MVSRQSTGNHDHFRLTSWRNNSIKPVPQELLKCIEELAPEDSEIIPLDGANDDGDDNIAI